MKASNPFRGFSLAELILGLGLMSLCLIALLSVTASSLRYNRQSLGHMNAVQVADAEMGRTLSQVLSGTPVSEQNRFWYSGDFTYPTTPFRTGQHTIGRETFHFAIYSSELTGVGSSGNELRRVDTYVWWTEANQPGQKITSCSRLINKGEEP